MQTVSIISDNIFSPLGSTTEGNFIQLKKIHSGIKLISDKSISSESLYLSMFQDDFNLNETFTKFEQLVISSIQNALNKTDIDAKSNKTIFILSTTKGNVDLLNKPAESKDKSVNLFSTGKKISDFFGFANKPVIVSNACISGILALLVAKRFLENGLYENAIVCGADIISKFVVSGFQSFQALSPAPCKPFDASRNGLTLGEAAATMVLSIDKKYSSEIKIMNGATSNDANHISGPSKTGEELSMAINKTLSGANVSPSEIDFISAHGTATLYNDEMEAKAISLSGLEAAPVNSLKGFYGHTLGAAGIVESIVTIQSMKENLLIPTKGFENIGVSKPVNIIDKLEKKYLNKCLKTASGFGGCNAAILFGN